MNNYYNPAMHTQQYGRMQGCVSQARQAASCGCGTEQVRQVSSCGIPTAKTGCQQPPVVGALPSNATVAMAYVPFQQCTEVYEDMTALSRGTLFPALDKPFEGCR